jgi:integrase
LIQAGQSVKTVQAVLGHSSATETLDVYGHLWPDAEDNARTAMNRLFTPTSHDSRLGRRQV